MSSDGVWWRNAAALSIDRDTVELRGCLLAPSCHTAAGKCLEYICCCLTQTATADEVACVSGAAVCLQAPDNCQQRSNRGGCEGGERGQKGQLEEEVQGERSRQLPLSLLAGVLLLANVVGPVRIVGGCTRGEVER